MVDRRWFGIAALVALASCSPMGGGTASTPVTPGDALGTQTLKAVPIQPTPTPTPTTLTGALTGSVAALACGVTAGVSCHVLAGAGPQGLPANTPAANLPGLHPADLQSAYRLPSSAAGRGQTIGIAVAYDDPDLESDLAVYRSAFGLPPCTTSNGCFAKIALGPLGIVAGNQGWGQESSMDVQLASAICPNCRIVVAEAPSDSPSDLLAAARAAVARGATVVSDSYSLSEYGAENDAAYAIGVPFVFGAGDGGPSAEWPASSSHVIAVGGTSLARDASPRGWSETVWSSSGGGCSAYVAKPAWQTDSACANRTSNDLSAFADPNPGVAVYDSYLPQSAGWRTYGGTSAAAPIVAGAIALAANAGALGDGASYVYAHAGSFNPVAATSGSQAGLGSPNGVAGL